MFDLLAFLEDNNIETDDYYEVQNGWRGPCPVHGGDNRSAFSMFHNGFWHCFSQECHEEYGYNIAGLMKGLGVNKHDTNKYFNDSKPTLKTPTQRRTKRVTRDLQLSYSEYINSRGFTEQFAKKYNFGIAQLTTYDKGTKEYIKHMSVCFKVYDEHGEFRGCSYRRIQYDESGYSKWYHVGLKTNEMFYNENNFDKSKPAIIVEGPWDVLSLERNYIRNSLGTFGVGIKHGQIKLLKGWGVKDIVLGFDNDDSVKKYLYGYCINNKFIQPHSFNKVKQEFKILDMITPRIPPSKDLADLSDTEMEDIFYSNNGDLVEMVS